MAEALNLKNIKINPEVIKKIPAKFVNYYKFMPLELENNILSIAIEDTNNTHILDEIKLLLGFDLKIYYSLGSDIEEAIRKYYGIGTETIERIFDEKALNKDFSLDPKDIEDLKDLTDEVSITKFVNQILIQAIKDRATDIHLEPQQDLVNLRFRIDGILYDIKIPPKIKYFYPAIISRIKIMAHLNIAEHRLPQDGRIKVKVNNEELDLRISILPSSFGQTMHIRILSPHFFLKLENLGLDKIDIEKIIQVIKKPHGIILVTGPTGSGKSTTLYACLDKLNLTSTKIITIEDPVEYQMSGITQIQVMPKIGLNFATGLRHMLRHDPDVMMIGEIRDFETAEIAIRAALTGHLVFSTLHTNDAIGAVTRLIDMGIEPYLLSSSLECLMAQRLVRLICPKCKTKISLPKKLMEEIKNFNLGTDNIEIYEGKGCEFCRFTGFYGRTAIYELLILNPDIKNMVLNRVSNNEIKQKAIQQGMRTLRQDGILKVFEGLTTFSEIMRVTE
ncbi:MAG: GspE/PulE family protein [Candidatus Omnitrophota bacterium]